VKNKPVTINSIFSKPVTVFNQNTSYSNENLFILCQYQNWSTQSVHIHSIINLEIKSVDNLKKNFLTISIALLLHFPPSKWSTKFQRVLFQSHMPLCISFKKTTWTLHLCVSFFQEIIWLNSRALLFKALINLCVSLLNTHHRVLELSFNLIHICVFTLFKQLIDREFKFFYFAFISI